MASRICAFDDYIFLLENYFLSVKRQDGMRNDSQNNDQTTFCDENKLGFLILESIELTGLLLTLLSLSLPKGYKEEIHFPYFT